MTSCKLLEYLNARLEYLKKAYEEYPCHYTEWKRDEIRWLIETISNPQPNA